MDCYIYYRCASRHQLQVAEQAGELQQRLSHQTGVAVELKRRPETENDMQTWMEVYRKIPEDFAVQMEAALQQTSLRSLIDGQRHVEYFMDVTSCA
ncbi:DUF4936 family protein [Undibacterium sp.]|jgi:hypothetical protein|uniref:DUF4936 family protein n=1 Tax=Undibacterium sp. TaxID=1914977 RepID=UPI002B5F1C9E|nr:DUF4936 family protein [Undibacterium sp.]HTD04474.1 DUF4936 family protein [Undibacterium sp.]